MALTSSAVSHGQQELSFSAKGDYITCAKQPCVFIAGSKWSKDNPSGVAVSVSMGTNPAIPDDEIKSALSRDLEIYGVEHIRFFFEQNDVPASVFGLHVRGGTEGPFVINNIRQNVEAIARRALNDNKLFRD